MREEKGYRYLIEVDGGVNGETAKLCAAAGVDVAVAGSYVYYMNDIKAAIDSIKSIRGTGMEVVIVLEGLSFSRKHQGALRKSIR